MIPQIPVKLAQSPKTILDGAALDIRKTSPALNLGSGVVCNVPPLLAEQESFYCGIWNVGSIPTPTSHGSVMVFQVISADVVSRWMKTEATLLAPGWVAVPYDIGVPAYLSTLQSPYGVGITFGKGRFIVLVNGTSKTDVERVARAVLGQISD
jgi:hypothetical protein